MIATTWTESRRAREFEAGSEGGQLLTEVLKFGDLAVAHQPAKSHTQPANTILTVIREVTWRIGRLRAPEYESCSPLIE